MKTRTYLLSALIFIFLTTGIQPARSQILISILLGKHLNSGAIEFGLTGGLNRNWMYQIENAEGQNQFNVGFYFDVRLKKEKRWYLYTGCLVKSTMGATKIDLYNLDNGNVDSSMVGGYINRKVNYFQVPIAIKYRFKSNVYAVAGVQLGLRNKATDEFTNEIYEKDDLILKVNNNNEYRRIDAGLTGGVGYKFRYGANMNIGVRYYLGISEIYKGDFKTAYGYVSNSSLYVFAEFPIGAKREVRPQREPKEKKRKKDRAKM
jgi:hypothetical protein